MQTSFNRSLIIHPLLLAALFLLAWYLRDPSSPAPPAQSSIGSQAPQFITPTVPPSPLFHSDTPILLELAADFDALTSGNGANPWREARLRYVDDGDAPTDLAAELKLRGKATRGSCRFPRFWVRVIEDEGTLFDAAGEMKLQTHCAPTDDARTDIALGAWAVRREHHLHTMLRLLWDSAPRTRIARVTYQDGAGRKLAESDGLLLEPNESVAERLGGELFNVNTRDDAPDRSVMDPMLLALVDFFEILVLNFDYQIYDLRPRDPSFWGQGALHNIVAVELPTGMQVPVPWDFDRSMIVRLEFDAPAPSELPGFAGLSGPGPRLMALELQRWRDRHPREAVEAVAARVREQLPALLRSTDDPDLDPKYRNTVRIQLDALQQLIAPERLLRLTVITDAAVLYEDPFGTKEKLAGGLRGALVQPGKVKDELREVRIMPLYNDAAISQVPPVLSGWMRSKHLSEDHPPLLRASTPR